ncbi:MAG: diphthine--ammonia ligase [Candidatus Altiarchaeota archaeon]
MLKKAAVLWTGGKESALALHLAEKSGIDAVSLVTFAPPEPEFLAHPLSLMRHQADSLGLPHRILTVDAPYRDGYARGLGLLKAHGIEAVITGDIAEAEGHPDLVRECCEDVGLKTVRPLWGMEGEEMMGRLLTGGFKAIFSLVKRPWLTEEWVGKELGLESLELLRNIPGLDLCGERGEYHTMVLDAPMFERRIRIRFHSTVVKGDMAYMDVNDANIV